MDKKKVTVIKRVLLINPFMHRKKNLNIGIDMVVSRHAGQQIKTGVTFPIGLAYMGAVLKNAGFTIRIVDPIANTISTKTIYSHSNWADAIVMPYSPAHHKDLEGYFYLFKNKLRIMGGGIAPYMHNSLFSHNLADIIIKGEPEEAIVEIMVSYPHIEGIAGIFYRSESGKKRETPDRPPITDLDSLPFPLRDFTDKRSYWDISFYGKPTAWILPTRGCTYSCIFCAQQKVNNKQIRRRSPKNIADEIEEIAADLKVFQFVFFDETFNLDANYTISVCDEIISRKLSVKWWCSARPDCVTYEMAIKMKEAGCIEMRFGIESADNTILKYLQKNTTVQKMQKGVEITKNVGINFSYQCIFGSPMETNETIQKTKDFIKRTKPLFVSFNVLTPLPGSALFESAKKNPNVPFNLNSFDIIHTNYSLGPYSPAQLSTIIKKAYKDYYFSFSFFIRITKEFIKNPIFILGIIKTVLVQGLYMYRSIIGNKVYRD